MCLTSPATVVQVEMRGGIPVVTVRSPDEGERECITYVDGLLLGERVLVAGGAIVERLGGEFEERLPSAALLIEAFDATHHPGGTRL